MSCTGVHASIKQALSYCSHKISVWIEAECSCLQLASWLTKTSNSKGKFTWGLLANLFELLHE